MVAPSRLLAHIVCPLYVHAYLNIPEMDALHRASDFTIGVSYIIISLVLAYLVFRVRNLPFHRVFLAFGLFLISCGVVHFMEILVPLDASYGLQGIVKALTAVASLATALMLPPLLPSIFALFRAVAVSEERQRRLEASHQELENAYKKIRDLDETKTAFFANLSHELRTPLTLVLGPVEKLLVESCVTDVQRHHLEVVARNARLLLRHVNDLLDIAKVEAGKIEINYFTLDLTQLVRSIGAHFDFLARQRHIVFTVETPTLVSAQVDPEKMQQILLNLLANAFKFTPDHGHIRCCLCTVDSRARLEVQDSGPGVLPEMRKAIFERFCQGEGGPDRRFGGSGLGLAIVRDLVHLHQGTIHVEDGPHRGALFVVEVPLLAPVDASVRNETMVLASEESARLVLADLQTQTDALPPPRTRDQSLILVVEDHPEMQQYLVETLANNYRLVTACNGREGWEKALKLRPDLIISDIMMPGYTGDELVQKVRAHAELDTTPIILLTARADEELRIRLLRQGAQDYLQKPFRAQELLARVGNLITMKRARDVLQREADIHVHNLEALAREVACRQRKLHLALDAMQLARHEAERASQIKSNFLSLVSHELRTPLNTIQLYLQSLQRDRQPTLSPRQRKLVSKIRQASQHLLTMIESILDYTQLQNGRLIVQRDPIDLATLVAEVLENSRAQAELKQLRLQYVLPEPLPLLVTDRRLVHLILANLVDNAIKFTEQGSVTVLFGQREAMYYLEVQDTGPGIPVERQGVIFEPFEHLEPIRRKHTPGVGLGLTLVKEMIRKLGGRIELESEVDVGSTFTIWLPSLQGGLPDSDKLPATVDTSPV